MPTRLIIDGSLTEDIKYFETFPVEPTINPNGDIAVRLPIDQADRLKPITLLALLTRMAALPAAERELLIVTHGNNEGLPLDLVKGAKFNGHVTVLHILRVVGEALTEVNRINGLPAGQRAAAWVKLLSGLRYFDGTKMFPDLPGETAETYRALFEYFLKKTAGEKADMPPTDATSFEWATVSLEVGRQNLDKLLALGNQVRGRAFDRIDIRGCNIGEKNKSLEVIRLFFGCRVVTGPKVLAWAALMTVNLNAKFDQDFDNNVDRMTLGMLYHGKNAIAGRQPVQLNKAGQEVTVPMSSMPATRRFDASAKRPGDEVFIRMWISRINPSHSSTYWMVAISDEHVKSFVRDRIATDISRWKTPRLLPVYGFWLMDDFGASLVPRAPVVIDPNAPIPQNNTLPPPPPAFALPRDPEYRQFLASNP